MMPVAKEDVSQGAPRELVSSRTPKGARKDKDNASVGMLALNDSLILLGVCWAVVIVLWFSLRQSNA